MKGTALFPGSFDPFTLGHKFVVDQGLELFDRIVIAIGVNSEKAGLLTPDNRGATDPRPVPRRTADRGADLHRADRAVVPTVGCQDDSPRLRNTVDFEYERNIMQVNRALFPEINTVLLFTPADYVAISSSVIRELLAFGGDPTPLMPENIDIKNYM